MNGHDRTSRRPPSRAAGKALPVTVVLALLSTLAMACGSTEGDGGQAGGTAAGCDRAANYPRGPVQLIVPWAAGGGTDSVARFIGNQLAQRLDTQVNVVNRTGGSGVVGHSAIANARPDGSTIGMITVELTMMHWQGLTELTHERVTPIGQVNADPAGVTVQADAPWDDIQGLLDEAGQNPGELTASGTGRGGIWDLARAGMLMEAGMEADAIRWVPSDGAAPALQELVAGGIDISTASLVENRTMLEEGRAKALAIMADERDPNFPDVPTLKEQGIDFTMAAWRGIAGPTGMSEGIAAELSCHLDDVVHSDAYENFMSKSGYGIVWRGPDDFASYLAAQDKEKGEIMRSAGLAE